MNVNISDYTGDRIAHTIDDEKMRACFIANRNQMKANYLETVDAALADRQIRMCDETKDFLYAVPAPVRYVKGTRPELECYAAKITNGCSSDFERVIAIMDHLKLLYEKCHGRLLFYGGTEEELLHKGEQLCECLSRLTCALCEVCKIPARIITHCLGGHVTNEVFTENKWWYVDSRAGVYFLGKDEKPASLWELWHDHSIIDLQTREVRQHVSPRFTWEQRAERLKKYMLSEYEVNTVKYYSLADAEKYSYRWVFDPEILALNRTSREYSVARGAIDSSLIAQQEPEIEFSFAEEQVLSGRIMICVYCKNFVVMPQTVTFLLNDTVIYRTPEQVPLAELHHPVSGVFTLGGSGEKFDVTKLEAGKYVLTVQCRYSDEVQIEGRRSFLISKE